MKISELPECPEWLRDADTCDADVNWLNNPGGCLVWLGGVWLRGVWLGGVWLKGEWYGGEWLRGEWHGGEWYGGEWHDGDFNGGDWYGGNFNGGNWRGGNWLGGVWYGGEWLDARYDRVLYMLAMCGVVFDGEGFAVAYRSVSADNHGRYTTSFVQTSGDIRVAHDPAGRGTCCRGLHVSSAATAWSYYGINPSAKLWRVRFRREDVLDCDGQKIRLSGGFCDPVKWPFAPTIETKQEESSCNRKRLGSARCATGK